MLFLSKAIGPAKWADDTPRKRAFRKFRASIILCFCIAFIAIVCGQWAIRGWGSTTVFNYFWIMLPALVMQPFSQSMIGPDLAIGENGLQHKLAVYQWKDVRDCHWAPHDRNRLLIRVPHNILSVSIPPENRAWVEQSLTRLGKMTPADSSIPIEAASI